MDKKEIIHAVAIGSVLVLNLSSTAYAGLSGDACTNGTATTIVSEASGFIKNGFLPKCSANVSVKYDSNETDFFVKGASVKGSHTFGGSTVGGGVAACEPGSIANPQSSVTPGTVSVTFGPIGC